MSEARQQAFIDAPVGVVWELLEDVDRHPEWWPRVLEVECDEDFEPGCTYREVVQGPVGKDEMLLRVDRMEDCKELLIRCVNTGTFVHWLLTEAQDGTFVDARFGMEPGQAPVPGLRLGRRQALLPKLAASSRSRRCSGSPPGRART